MSAKKGAAAAPNVVQDSYDEFPYESYVYPQTHPERLYTIGKLFGLNPVDINKARILEIGGAGGGNVIPIALLYPKTNTVSFDLSNEQIAQANKSKKAMGIKNIEFLQRDLTKLEKDLGEFDYIICHGVFSWVPDFVRDEIFEVCRRHLSKDGLAVISYNVLPGWAAVNSLRDMMVYHTQDFKTPQEQIKEARNLLNFMYENTPPSNEVYRQIIDRERKILSTTNDSYVFHEHLESENHQYYLHDFVKMALDHKLTYVGDAEISTMYLGNFNEKVRETLGAIKDIVRQEQYIDFLTNRRFRHSILAREDNAKKINRNLNMDQISQFYVQARFRPDTKPSEDGSVRFIAFSNAEAHFGSTDETTHKVFTALAEKNRPVKIETLAAELKKTQNIDPEATKTVFARNGLTLLLQNFLSLHEHEVAFENHVSKKPRAFSWARHQAETGDKNLKSVTNLKRETVAVTPLAKTLLPYLDGKHTHEQLIDELTKHVLKDDIKIHKEKVQITDEKEIREIMKQQLTPALNHLAKMALLEA